MAARRISTIYNTGKSGRLIEEKAGRQFKDDMTPAKATRIRTQKIEGDQLTNQERRDVARKSHEV